MQSDERKQKACEDLHKPALDVDLSTMLPLVIQYLICGKGTRQCKSSDL